MFLEKMDAFKKDKSDAWRAECDLQGFRGKIFVLLSFFLFFVACVSFHFEKVINIRAGQR